MSSEFPVLVGIMFILVILVYQVGRGVSALEAL